MSDKILHLTLKKQWFDMIASGEKREEYRETKLYWRQRLEDGDQFKHYDVIKFRNGYKSDSPAMFVRLVGIEIGIGKREWGAPIDFVYKLILGDILP